MNQLINGSSGTIKLAVLFQDSEQRVARLFPDDTSSTQGQGELHEGA